MKQIDADMTTIQHKIGEDILLINGQKEGMQAALSEYKRSMDVSASIAAAQRYMEAKRAEEELTRQLQATQVDPDAEIMQAPAQAPASKPATTVQDAMPKTYSDGQPVRKELMFKVLVSFEEMQALNRFLIENKIQFRQIKA